MELNAMLRLSEWLSKVFTVEAPGGFLSLFETP